MLSEPKTKGGFDFFTPKGIISPEKEKLEHTYQKEDNLHNGLEKEATVLGTIHILCSMTISSLGAILISAPYSSNFNPAVSTILMSGYPFGGALCFAVTGFLSIISGKKSAKAFAMSSLTSTAVSSVAAGAGLLLLADSLVALRTASQQCESGKEYLSSLPYSRYYYSTYEVKECFLAGISLIGVLVVMLTFTVLELLLAAYASVLWWKLVYSKNSGVSTLTCHMISAGSQDLRYDDRGLTSSRKRSQLVVMKCT
ncbi:membrane-spanning 4-domains subfamily A member 7 isoform X1 [Equus quagga]|uniref:membrane-spanning 4-domains subfamily A member 7 isoform X1 n=1 Tax=Equus quagga TaxID=89248 RepID=UPI001EE185D0|nr:membrane-spanning 4-domains subfamily A member 7 isoform X1 [Equus quagga]